MDIQITYETLFDILRKERSLEELQSLDDNFLNEVVKYILERKAFFEKTNVMEQEKAKLQLKNIQRILKEIYERREQKIVRLSLNVIKTNNTGFVDKRNMLPTEKEFFDEISALLTKYKQGILLQIFQGRKPLIIPKELPTNNETETKEEPINNKVEETKEEKSEIEETKEEKSEIPPMKEGTTIVRFKMAVPKFLGKNKKIFGPFDKGKITQLPAKIAQILIKKGKVEAVMNS